MSLDAALGIASNALANINLGFSVVSQNVANAQTPGYSAETSTQISLDAGGLPLGVRSGLTLRATDPALQGQVYSQNAAASGFSTASNALAALQPALGSVAGNNDLGSLLGQVQNGFSALLTDPADQTQQAHVVSAAGNLAAGINRVAASYAQARQSAQDNAVAGIATLNQALGQVGQLSTQIIALRSQGLSTADLENQRNQAAGTIAGLVDARFVEQPNGDLQVLTRGGAVLPTQGGTPLSLSYAGTGATVSYVGGTLPGIRLGGADVTAQLSGGSIGAAIALRDTTIPTYQAGLDEFAQNLSGRFAAQGLTLFTNPQGNVPVSIGPNTQSGYVGYAGSIGVNPAVTANISLVRDGTNAIAGSATGASAFTPNPSTGPPGFATLIDRVLNFALGTEAQTGVAQIPGATSGLGPDGNLASPFGPQPALSGFANALTASQSAQAGQVSQLAADAQATQTALSGKLSGEVGVNVDQQLAHLVELQNAYGANAKIISSVQSMFAQLLAAVV